MKSKEHCNCIGSETIRRQSLKLDMFSVMLPTCITDSVSHLKTTDGAGVVLIVTFEDELQT